MRIVDLTHTLREGVPVWPGGLPFSREVVMEEPVCVQTYHSGAGVGTHMDAPAHFVRGGRQIHELSIDRLVGEGCVIHLASKVGDQADYKVSRGDLLDWEREHGAISERSIVLIETGWSRHWSDDPERYLGGLVYPSLSVEAAELLLERGAVGLGVDTLGPDASPDCHPVHDLLLGRGLFFIENLTRLGEVPARGATIIALPMRIEGAAEAFARVIAMVADVD